MQVSSPNAVNIRTYSRLHLGFLDLSDAGQTQAGNSPVGTRQFGSLGVAIDAFATDITLTMGDSTPSQSDISLSASLTQWVTQLLLQQQTAFAIRAPLHLRVNAAIPRHAGLGSGTQMALAIGTACAILAGQSPAMPTQALANIAQVAGRGTRSGIGIGTFAQGGLVVDGGHGPHTLMPPILCRHAIPHAWRVLLVVVNQGEGLHGQAEKSAFARLTPQSLAATQALAHAVLLHALPAVVEADFATFAECIGRVQRYNADYFAPAQGGAYANAAVATVLAHCQQLGYRGIGQTSWGPTGFVWCETEQAALDLQAALQRLFGGRGLSFQVTQAVNTGATIALSPAI